MFVLLSRSYHKYIKNLRTDIVREDWPGYILIAYFLASLLAFVNTVVLSHLFSSDDFGTYRFAISLTPLLSTFTIIGSHTFINTFHGKQAASYIAEITPTRMRSALWGVLLMLCVGFYNIYFSNTYLGYIFLVLGIHTIFPLSLDLFFGYYFSNRHYRTFTLIQTTTVLISLCTVIISTYLYRSPLITLIALTSVLALMYSSVLYRILRTYSLKLIFGNTQKIQEKNSLYITYSYLLDTLSVLVDKIIVFTVLGSTIFASYTLSTIFIDQVRGILIHLGKPLFKRLSELHGEAKKLYMHELRNEIILGTTLILLVWIVVASFVYSYLFGSYKNLYTYSLFYMLSTIGILGYFRNIYLWEGAHFQKSLVYQIIFLVTLSVLVSVGATFWGIIGALSATACTNIIFGIYAWKKFM